MKLVKLKSSQNFHFIQLIILTKSQFRAVFPTVSCATSSFVAFYGCFGCLQLHFIFISLGSLAGWLGGTHTHLHTHTHLYAKLVAVENLCSCCCCCWGCFLRRISINYVRPLCDCNSCVPQPPTRTARATAPANSLSSLAKQVRGRTIRRSVQEGKWGEQKGGEGELQQPEFSYFPLQLCKANLINELELARSGVDK